MLTKIFKYVGVSVLSFSGIFMGMFIIFSGLCRQRYTFKNVGVSVLYEVKNISVGP